MLIYIRGCTNMSVCRVDLVKKSNQFILTIISEVFVVAAIVLKLIKRYLSAHAASIVRLPFKSELLQLDAPNNMISEIWDIVFKYCAPDLEVC